MREMNTLLAPHWKSNTPMPPTAFGTLLRQLRESRGLTLEVLADKAGFSHVAIGDWERGKRNPKRPNVEAVASALEVPADDLLAAAGFIQTHGGVKPLRYIVDPADAEMYDAYDNLPEPVQDSFRENILRVARELRRDTRSAGEIGIRSDEEDNPSGTDS